MWAAFLVAMIPLVWILGSVVVKGGQLLLDLELVDQLPARDHRAPRRRRRGPRHPGHAHRGRWPPRSSPCRSRILTAIYLVEYGRGRLARAVSFMVDILTGVPSIVAALFIYAVWVTTFGFQRVGFAVCLPWCC